MSFVNESFNCPWCNRTLPITIKSGNPLGYAIIPGPKLKMCYDCVAKVDASEMMEKGVAILYLNNTGLTKWNVSNWPQTLVFPVQVTSITHHNICGANGRRDVWFVGPDGQEWHGVNISIAGRSVIPDNQITHCKRTKQKKKDIKPLNPSTYLKPYAYANTQANPPN